MLNVLHYADVVPSCDNELDVCQDVLGSVILQMVALVMIRIMIRTSGWRRVTRIIARMDQVGKSFDGQRYRFLSLVAVYGEENRWRGERGSGGGGGGGGRMMGIGRRLRQRGRRRRRNGSLDELNEFRIQFRGPGCRRFLQDTVDGDMDRGVQDVNGNASFGQSLKCLTENTNCETAIGQYQVRRARRFLFGEIEDCTIRRAKRVFGYVLEGSIRANLRNRKTAGVARTRSQ
mmetsp:Transcript_14457/g.25311  ORF Transcript_14457/g.25311 Transcript_14457/m.25311 type:complete len:232 (-) Transcript_14457:579-1274(-)